MLFNTLANLRVLIAIDPARAQDMLDHLIAYLRATLSGSRSTVHPLSAEFDRVRDYLELMAIRMGPRLHYRLELPDTLRAAQVPPLLLQPLVENAIRHGLEPQIAGGSITVRASIRRGQQSDMLVLDVVDDGMGLSATADTKASMPFGAEDSWPQAGTRFGLEQIRARLQTLYGATGTIELIAGSPGITCARATFPLNFSDCPQRAGDTVCTRAHPDGAP